MSKMISIRNQEHPKVMMENYGKKVQSFARSLSNKDLDIFISSNTSDKVFLAEIMPLPRGKKIKVIRRAAMLHFVEDWKAQPPAPPPQVRNNRLPIVPNRGLARKVHPTTQRKAYE